jgi:hypothetical protein
MKGKWSRLHTRNQVTVRVTFTNNVVMLFGTSYRTWWSQLKEFIGNGPISVKRLDVSKEPWIAFGGLKWCAPEALQTELDAEGKGRTADAFKFTPASDWDWDRYAGDEFA